MKTRIKKWNILDRLRTDAEITGYLDAALEENDYEFFIIALGTVAKARGINEMAKRLGVSRESLYKSFSGKRRPNFETVFRAIDDMGLRIHITPQNAHNSHTVRRAGRRQ